MHVYILQRPDGLLKIGFSTDPTTRLRNLETQGGFSASSAWVSVPTEKAKSAERKAHKKLSEHRVIGEWFDAGFDDALGAVLDALSDSKSDGDTEERAAPPQDSMQERLVYAVKSRGLTQQQFADSLGLTKGAVNHWLTGRYALRFEHIEQVSAILGVSPAWLAFGHGPVEQDAVQIADILAHLLSLIHI